ncbi:hypothetical protein CBL_09664 [Carabus blaptoides fortunei]
MTTERILDMPCDSANIQRTECDKPQPTPLRCAKKPRNELPVLVTETGNVQTDCLPALIWIFYLSPTPPSTALWRLSVGCGVATSEHVFSRSRLSQLAMHDSLTYMMLHTLCYLRKGKGVALPSYH